jgi:signal transduction histidine kinase
MYRSRAVLLFFFIFFSLLSKGEQPIDWYPQDRLLKNGVFKNYGLVNEPKSFGVVFNNKTNQKLTYYLKINNPHINLIYVLDSKQDTLFVTGDRYPFSTRPIYFWEFVFPIQINAQSTDSIKFQIHKKGENLAFHTLLIAEKSYNKIHDSHLYFFSTFLSISIFLFLGFIFLGAYKKESKHFLFAAFIFASVGWVLNERGIFFQYLWPNNIALQERMDTFFVTPSLGLALIILFFNETYKNLIGKNIKGVLILFLLFLTLRTIFVLFYPGLNDNPSIKLNLLRISNGIVISMILFFIVTLFQFGIKKVLFLDTLAFIVYFAYLLKLALRQNNIDFVLTERFYGFGYPLMQTLTIGIFSVSNYMKHRMDRIKELEQEQNLELEREKNMTETILGVQENEREVIGRNIHDQIGGLLAATKIKLQTLKLKPVDQQIHQNIDEIINIINRSSDEMYNIVDDLVPPMMEGKDLNAVIRSRIEIVERDANIEFTVAIPDIRLAPKDMLKFYRIISELVTNSIKHAKCNKINISVSKNEIEYIIDYTDNGIGFSKQVIRNHGLNNLESRVKFLHGTIDFHSVPGNTHYTIHLPLQEYEK